MSDNHSVPNWQAPILAGVFCLLTILGAQVSIPIWEVPFTLQTVAVYGSGLFLAWHWAALSQIIYLGLGLFLPVFAGDGSGSIYLFSRLSSGYLLSFPFVAALVSLLANRIPTGWGRWLSLQAGSILLFLCGSTWLFIKLQTGSPIKAAQIGWVNYIPVDQLKIGLTLLVFYLVNNVVRKSRMKKIDNG